LVFNARPVNSGVMPLQATFAMTTCEKWSLIVSSRGFFPVVLSMAVLAVRRLIPSDAGHSHEKQTSS